ncbi:hypothetical protein NQ317_006865 [Molorchus minor]|uniref:Uncharacterized protein n=1 Tax=Molorchus minor TaxID=1323400 RepID=A0ABQ9K085_9CUCU|nr:hypothetical protein NQ317_006865 [Molorchus minor]
MSPAKCLEMKEMVRVKHNVPKFPNVQSLVGKFMQRNAPDCAGLLKRRFDILNTFLPKCPWHEDRKTSSKLKHLMWKHLNHLKRAPIFISIYIPNLRPKKPIVSVSSQSISDQLNNDESGNPAKPANSLDQMKARQIPSPENFMRIMLFPKPNNKNTIPAVSKPDSPSFEDIITNPEHTEVFNIRVKRNSDNIEEKPEEIVNVPLERDSPGTPWDILNFMGQVRYSFFGKLFEDQDKNRRIEEENHIPQEVSNTNEDPGLFDTVTSTLSSLQQAPGETFLMVVFGGHLSEISNPRSPLVQSVKHVTENTDPESTLVVLTGTCSVRIGEGGMETSNDLSENGEMRNGPRSGDLKDCQGLYDIPLIVKNILEESSPNFGGPSRVYYLDTVHWDLKNTCHFCMEEEETAELEENAEVLLLRSFGSHKALAFEDRFCSGNGAKVILTGCMGSLNGLGPGGTWGGDIPRGTGDMAAGHLGLGHGMPYGNRLPNMFIAGLPSLGGGEGAYGEDRKCRGDQPPPPRPPGPPGGPADMLFGASHSDSTRGYDTCHRI